MEKATLYYFPYAGASSATYKSWIKNCGDVNFVVMDYPGHGKRSYEQLLNSASDVCEDLLKIIKNRQDFSEKYYFAGHCLGALIAYEICRMIEAEGSLPAPRALFLSGHGAPDKVVNEGLYKMTDDELIEYQRRVGGIPDELLQEEYLDYVKEIVLPLIRSDSETYESYQFHGNEGIVNVPLIIINGLKDWKSPREEVKRWNEFTRSYVKYVDFDDDHYFLNKRTDEYLGVIMNEIKEDV